MRNLIVFFYRNVNLFVFLSLEVSCLYLLFSNNPFQRASFITSSNEVVGNLFMTVNNVQEYFHLKETNEYLASENAWLRSRLKDAYSIFNKKEVEVRDSVYRVQYKFVNARVINNSVNRRNNFLTLNVGSLQGVRKEMGVMCTNGIVGIVKDVSPHFCSVMSVLNKEARISAKIRKNGYYGSLFWEGGDYRYATLADIPTHVKLQVGDTVTTNSYSAIFPDNLLVGTVDKIDVSPGQNFYSLRIKFSANLKNITHVYIINNLFKDEQRALEERSQNDK